MVVGYVRVSDLKQDHENQVGEIKRYCDFHSIQVDKWVSEIISTRKEDREIFGLIDSMSSGDTLIVTELSRIGRTLTEVLRLIDILIAKKIRTIILKENLDVRDDNPMGMLTIHMVGAFYQFERSMISQRTKEAIKTKKDKIQAEIDAGLTPSLTIGRVKGSKNKEHKLLGKEKLIKEYLDKGLNKTEIIKLLDVSRGTFYAFVSEMGL